MAAGVSVNQLDAELVAFVAADGSQNPAEAVQTLFAAVSSAFGLPIAKGSKQLAHLRYFWPRMAGDYQLASGVNALAGFLPWAKRVTIKVADSYH